MRRYFLETPHERDFLDLSSSARTRAIQAYKALQEKDPDSGLLKFAKISESGWWIFKRMKIDVVPEHCEGYFLRYSGNEIHMDGYAQDLEKALGEYS